MDDLSSLLNTSKIGCHISDVCIYHVFYADDLCLMAPCAIALLELINICCFYSIEIGIYFNATKSYCMIFTPRNYKRFIPPLYLNKLPVFYTDFIKDLGYTFSSNNCDVNDMLMQMRMLYCRSNRLVRLFSKCSKPILLESCRSFCNVLYCSYFWTNYKKTTFSKIRVAYSNVYRKILGVPKCGRPSTMFLSNGIPNFEVLIRKSFFSFNSRLQTSCNSLICTVEQSWIVKNVIWKTWDDKMYT